MRMTPMSGARTGSSAKLAIALTVAASLATAGCTAGSTSAADSSSAGSSPATVSSPASFSSPASLSSSAKVSSPAGPPSRPATSGSGTGAKPGASLDPKSPLLVASSAVAQRSVANVTELHALATSAGKSTGIPASAIPTSAKSLSSAFKDEISASTMLKPPSGTAAATLVSALTSYQSLASQLAGWNATAAKPVPASFVTALKGADATWQTALKALGKATNRDLLKNMAPLIYP
jgi:hypothetical protein